MTTILVGIYSEFPAWNVPAERVAWLRDAFPGYRFVHVRSHAEALDHIANADIAFMSELRPAHLAAATRLKWVHSPAAGVGGMLFAEMIDHPVVITNSRGISAETIAEHVLAVTLALFRKLPLAFHSQTARRWAQNDVLSGAPIRTLAGARALVVGLGSIGMATARRLAALGALVDAVRRHPDRPSDGGLERVLPPDRLPDLLPSADVVVLAAPQTPSTRGLIGATELAAMSAQSILVNVSRGKLVDERALADALISNRIGGAALDVFEHEPLDPDSPLWALPHVLITPHMAGFRPDHWEAVTALFADNLRRFESGQPLRNVVNKKEGY